MEFLHQTLSIRIGAPPLADLADELFQIPLMENQLFSHSCLILFSVKKQKKSISTLNLVTAFSVA